MDLTCSPRHPSAALLLDKDLTVSFAGYLSTDDELLAVADARQPALIAIDAPLALPHGLCCLEEDCPCGSGGYPRRQAERELARQGIGCFFTTKKSLIKGMVYRGISLGQQLAGHGHQVVEVYPYASKVRLWGKPPFSKSQGPGLGWLRQRLEELLPALGSCLPGFNHHQCDAALAAYTAWLHFQGRSEVVGGREDGEIVLPRLTGGQAIPKIEPEILIGKGEDYG